MLGCIVFLHTILLFELFFNCFLNFPAVSCFLALSSPTDLFLYLDDPGSVSSKQVYYSNIRLSVHVAQIPSLMSGWLYNIYCQTAASITFFFCAVHLSWRYSHTHFNVFYIKLLFSVRRSVPSSTLATILKLFKVRSKDFSHLCLLFLY